MIQSPSQSPPLSTSNCGNISRQGVPWVCITMKAYWTYQSSCFYVNLPHPPFSGVLATDGMLWNGSCQEWPGPCTFGLARNIAGWFGVTMSFFLALLAPYFLVCPATSLVSCVHCQLFTRNPCQHFKDASPPFFAHSFTSWYRYLINMSINKYKPKGIRGEWGIHTRSKINI